MSCYSLFKKSFDFEEHQESVSYGLAHKLTLQRGSDTHVLSHSSKANDAANLFLAGRVVIDKICWYVLHYTANISNQKLMLVHIESKAATELSYNKRSTFEK